MHVTAALLTRCFLFSFSRFYLRERQSDVPWLDNYGLDPQILRDFIPFLLQKENREYPDLCQLPDLNEATLLENLRQRFEAGHIYTYVGSILIAVNPFKFHPIYNPKYVRLYQNQRIGPILPPHIFAIADNAYYNMLKEKRNQCIVISGESGSGKTESTNFLLHHLTALSQKGAHGSGVEQTILSAGPVLEAFGNAKTAHNNNSSRFGKFIQVNYRENGMVQGAVVQKYLLEKSRIVSQGHYERNYHVFYYLLSGATEQERVALHLLPADKYHYLNAKNLTLENCDEKYEFSRLKQSMEMVGFSAEKQRRLFAVLSAVLLLGNVEFFPKKSTYHHDESVQVRNPEVVGLISELLRVKQETLLSALTSKRVKASGETLIMQYKLPEAIAARDALAKCLYGALFDWIVLQVNHALLNKDQTMHTGHSIGVLDIFGFEDFGLQNSFEQLCINYANEHLQYYFNLHVFKYEQKEYKREGIKWTDIEFLDNSGCLQLFESKPSGLLCILDDLCNFPGATNETLLQKFNSVHKDSTFYEKPQRKENAFIIKHYAGKVKYQVAEMREKNLDLMRQDIVSVLKNSSMAFVRELVGADPTAIKTRKQPLTVTAQFQISLIALMETLNQANPFFIRCIKSNPNKISNQFDEATVTRQLRYTGMLETVRIRRAGYNVRLTYEEFIQLYRILLPKGLVSSQKDVRDFMNTMDLNKQHYQLGLTKIYMRESQKMRLDICLHTKIIDSIITIQRWFRSILQRKKYCQYRSAACTIQTYWRLYVKEKQAKFLRKLRTDAATIIQSAWRGYSVRKWYTKLKTGVQVIQARIRGNQARDRFKVALSKKLQRERAKLRSTQSLPAVERPLESSFDTPEIQHHKAIGGKKQPSPPVGISFESAIDIVNKNRALFSDNSLSSADFIDDDDDDEDEDDEDCYEDMGLVDDPSYVSTVLRHEALLEKNASSGSTDSGLLESIYGSAQSQQQQQHTKVPLQRQDDVLDRPIRKYEIERASKSTFDDAELAKYRYERGLSSMGSGSSSGKLPVRRVDSGPSPSHRLRYDAYGSGGAGLSSGMIRNQNHSNNSFSSSNVEIVLVNTGLDSLSSSVATSGIANSGSSGSSPNVPTEQPPQKLPLQRNLNRNTMSQTQQQSSTTLSRRELLCRSQGDEINSNYHLQHLQSSSLSPSLSSANYQNVQYNPSPTVAFHQHQQQQPLSYNNNNNNNTIKSTSTSNANSNSGSSNSLYNYVTQQQQPYIPSAGQSSLPPSQRVSSSYPDDFAQNYYNTTTPKGKAAALLGTKSEDSKYSGSKDIDLTLSNTHGSGTIVPSKTRRIKTNLSDDFSSGSGGVGGGGGSSGQTGLSRRGAISGMDTLKRRNSDPTNKIPLLEVNRGNDMYQSSTRINIAGHQFRKVQRINKAEKCASCQESDSFVNEGYRCLDCKVLVHTKCIQNGGIKSLQCAAKRSKRIRTGKHDKHAPIGASTPNSKFSATREYTDSTDKIISDAKELQLMQDFITQKICKMESDCEKPSEGDRVFKQALREFKDNLVAQYSVAHKQNSDLLNIKYRDLIANFEQVIETTSGRNNDFPLTMGVNAFRGFMNEFMNSRETEKPKAKRKKDKKRKHDEHTTYNGHTFQLTIINIATACEICQQFLLWPIERGLVCQNCRLTCHKRCYLKSAACSKIAATGGGPLVSGGVVTGAISNTDSGPGGHPNKLFGVPLTALCAGSDGIKIPAQIYSLIMMIEMHGLYSEGIYRKSGVSSKIKELKAKMDRVVGSSEEMDYESYNVHVLTNVLKSFLREMPEPLLTFDRYDDFLRAADLSDANDRVQTLLSLIKKIPPAHHCLLERLIFHLALVAKLEQYNRMSASSLAIVFAPCVLRTNRYVPAQDSLNDIGRQTKCMETLITQKMLNVKSTLADIDTLDTAAHTATTRLSTLRSSKVFTPEEMASNSRGVGGTLETETEEMLLEGHIQEIKKEKALLTSTLPSLARASSDDDLLSTDLDGEGGSLDDLSSSKDKDLDTSYNNMISDSGISIRYQAPSDHGSSNVSLNNDVPMAVSYNLRGDQSIDYFHKVGKTKSLSHQTLIDREAFLKSGSQSGSATTPQSPTTTITTSSSSPSSSSAPSMIKSQNGSTSSVSNNSSSTATSKRSDLNLSHSMVTLSTGVSAGGHTGSSELQRQKPIIMRSISGGYEPSSSSSSMSGGASNASSQKILIQQSASIPIGNKDTGGKIVEPIKMSRRMSGSRRQNSGGGGGGGTSGGGGASPSGSGNGNGDDEPIMV
ncbi:AAEL004375-PA [Aedes aegypti]|uniref:AAEL004375-PA n=1 Tax=Aedes aegypti TaxID=7159 RepID=Q17D27_AEDAE|nr:AAEL004375-PA [Aedes aegypti]